MEFVHTHIRVRDIEASLAFYEQLGFEDRSVAFPAISTGVYGYPRQAAATVAVTTLRSVRSSVERALLVRLRRRS